MKDLLENSESKRKFFTKHPQVKFYLIGTYSGLNIWVLSLLTRFSLVVTKLTEGNSQNQALKNSFVEVKVLSLAFHFS